MSLGSKDGFYKASFLQFLLDNSGLKADLDALTWGYVAFEAEDRTDIG